MNHEEIDKFDLINRYLMGKLPAAESYVFEEHFVDCPQCIAQLQVTKNFLQDLRLVAAKQTLQIDHHQPGSAFWNFLQPLFTKSAALAITCLLIAAVVGLVFFTSYTRRLRAELSQEKNSLEELQRRYEYERQNAILAEKKLQENELQQAEQLRALEAKVKDQEAQRTKDAAEFTRRMHSEGNLALFALTSIRSGEQNDSQAVNKIIIPPSSTMLAFSISLEGETGLERYSIKIFDDRDHLVWESHGLTPIQSDSLAVLLSARLLRPGHYSLIVEGFKKGGGKNVVGNYPLLIIKRP